MGSETTMKYKVGDKVRVVKSLDFPEMIGKIYTVMGTLPSTSCFACRIEGDGTVWGTLMFDHELEPVVKVGKQLEFAFMQTSG